MIGKSEHIKGKFCVDIEKEMQFIYINLYFDLQEDLSRFTVNDKLKYIENKQFKLKKKLIKSAYKHYFHKEDIKTNLKGTIEKYFNGLDIASATTIGYSELIEKGEYEVYSITGKILVHPLKPLIESGPDYNFTELYRFKALPEYIAWCKLDLELDLLYDQYIALEEYYLEQELPIDSFSNQNAEDTELHKHTMANFIHSDLGKAIIDKENEKDDNIKETIINAEDFIGFMNCDNNNKGGEIMNEVDYKRLLEYTQKLMDSCRVPENIIAIPKINLTKQEIVYTYKLIHDHKFPAGPRRKEYFVFLDKVFLQLHQPDLKIDIADNYQQSKIYKKFTEKPNRYHKLNRL